MNHDFICYIIISTIKIPHRLKNNFRYNYIVILYNNIIFRFSFQIRCSDEHTPRSGSEKIHFFFFFVANSTLISSLSVIFFSFSAFFCNTQRTHSKWHHDVVCIVFLLSHFSLAYFSFVLPVIIRMKRYTFSRVAAWCKESASSVSFLSFSFFSSFCLFFKYFALRARWPAFSAVFLLFFYLFCLFVCFFCVFFHLARFIEILD